MADKPKIKKMDPSAVKNKEKALELAIEAIHKAQGAGAIMTSATSVPGVDFFSSQVASIDRVLGGGWPRGRIVEIMGPESSGKTTLALHAIAEIQREGGIAAFIDAEHALDINYAAALGVDKEKLIISQPDSGEQALQIVETLTRSTALDLIVIDSVAALVPLAEIEGNIGDSHMGLQSRLMGQALRMLAGITHKTNTTLMFINQIRMKIGVMFGSPETTPGGNALKFYASQRVDVRRIGGVKDSEGNLVANQTRVKLIKSKVSMPFQEVEVQIKYGEGLDILADLLDISVDAGLVEKSGSWFSSNIHGGQINPGERLGQGVLKARAYLKENPGYVQELKNRLSSG